MDRGSRGAVNGATRLAGSQAMPHRHKSAPGAGGTPALGLAAQLGLHQPGAARLCPRGGGAPATAPGVVAGEVLLLLEQRHVAPVRVPVTAPPPPGASGAR